MGEKTRDDRIASQVDFGDEMIAVAEKPRRVNAVFDSVAKNYDMMNDLMSLGIHRLWKNRLISMIAPKAGDRLVDLAGGTGDIARRFLARGGGDALVCDINISMLSQGLRRDNTPQPDLRWLAADASRLPLDDNMADVITISFGLRNVTDRMAALTESLRILKPGGRFYCLEFSRPRARPLAKAYGLWSRLLPPLGGIVANDSASYRYLIESIHRFPDQETLAAMLAAAGFVRIRHADLTGGVAAVHFGMKSLTS